MQVCLPFMSDRGVFNPELFAQLMPEGELRDRISNNDCMGEVVANNSFEIRYGFLAVFQLLARYLKVDTPCLNVLLTPFMFQQKLSEIVHFYGINDGAPTLSAMDAFNYLRLCAVGGDKGDMRAFLSGLKSGRYVSANGTTLGYSRPVAENCLKNVEKSEKEFWKRPQFMYPLNREFGAVRQALCSANIGLMEGELSDYRAEGELVMTLIQSVQCYFAYRLYGCIDIRCGPQYVKDAVLSARGVSLIRVLPEDFPKEITINHECICYVRPGWIERVSLPNTAIKGVHKFFKPAAVSPDPSEITAEAMDYMFGQK